MSIRSKSYPQEGLKPMISDFKELVKRVGNYEFDPKKLDAIPITGTLRKSPDPKNCILVISSMATGDLIVEIEADDVVKHEVVKGGDPTGDQVTLHIKPTAIVTTSFRAKITNSFIPAFIVTSAFSQSVREPIPSVPWREIVTPFSRLDVMLNLLDGVAWADCRARGKADCEAHHPPGPARDQCITDRYIQCGPRPMLRVDERVLEQLVELFRGPIRS
jgi:hypothetical protein